MCMTPIFLVPFFFFALLSPKGFVFLFCWEQNQGPLFAFFFWKTEKYIKIVEYKWYSNYYRKMKIHQQMFCAIKISGSNLSFLCFPRLQWLWAYSWVYIFKVIYLGLWQILSLLSKRPKRFTSKELPNVWDNNV